VVGTLVLSWTAAEVSKAKKIKFHESEFRFSKYLKLFISLILVKTDLDLGARAAHNEHFSVSAICSGVKRHIKRHIIQCSVFEVDDIAMLLLLLRVS
jgi:hypothetical protein